MDGENVRIVEAFLNALKNKDLSDAPIADDLVFADPLMGKGQGADALKAFLSGFFPALNDLRIIRHVAEGEYVATHWEVDGIFNTIPIFELFRVQNGRIVEFRAFYDPRPIMG
jgi:limonene-1,2-epoxide hydrolase